MGKAVNVVKVVAALAVTAGVATVVNDAVEAFHTARNANAENQTRPVEKKPTDSFIEKVGIWAIKGALTAAATKYTYDQIDEAVALIDKVKGTFAKKSA